MKRYFLQTHSESLVEKFIVKYGEPELLVTHTPKNISENIINYLDVADGDFKEKKYCMGPPLSADEIEKYSDLEAKYLRVSNRINQHFSYDEKLYLYYRQLRFWKYKISSIMPLDFAFFENIPHEGFDFLIYEILKREGVDVVCGYRIPNIKGLLSKRYLCDDIYDHGKIFNNWRQNEMNNISKIDFAQEFKILLTNSEESKPTLQHIRPTPIKPKRNLILLIRKYGIRKLIMRFFDKIYPFSEVIIYLCSSNKQLVTNKSLEKYYNKLKSQRIPSFGYIYFPLHFEPELSTIPLGFPFRNQFQALEMLASELEKRDIPIIVKEHPRAYENKRKYLRSKKIYDDLLKYNNVYLIDKDITSKKIIDNSLAVATITGTSGWEAFLQGKPVMAFGSIFYTSAPGVFKIKNVIDLENCLNKILKGDFLITRNDKINFIKELDKYSFNAYVDRNFNESIPFTREESDENTLNALDDHLKKRQYNKNIL